MQVKTNTNCNRQLLDDYLDARLDDETAAKVESHLTECETCRDQIETASCGGDWKKSQSLLIPDEIDRQISSLSDDSHGSTIDESSMLSREILGWLDPTDDPHMLGRFAGYEIIGIVGHGGMGIVLKGFEASLNRYVAIKILAPRLATNGSARKRFAREAQAAAAVRHDNVIAIHRVDEWHGLPFLVMPYAGGISLQRRIDSDGPLSIEQTLRVGVQIASGLAAAHAQGLIHRDIKPANILLEQGVERVTITDFGLARAADDASVTRTGVIAGTPQYMSPEQAEAKQLDARSDLFSLGSVLYALATGRPPFRGTGSFEVLKRIVHEPARPMREIEASVPEWFENIVRRLHSKSPNDRPSSASEVAELLQECLAHIQQPTTTPLPESVAALAPKQSRRLPIGKFVAAAAFAFSLIFAGVLIVLELNKGTLTIECEADDVPIRIMQGDVVKKLTVSRKGKSYRIAAGNYTVELDGDFSDMSVVGDVVSIRRGDTVTVRIARNDSNDAVHTNQPESLSTDWLAVLQGRWNVVQQRQEDGVSKRDMYTAFVHGKRVEVQSEDGKGFMEFDFIIGAAGPPQQIDLKPVLSDFDRQEMLQAFGDNGEQAPEAIVNPVFHGIIESNGDTLRICNHLKPCFPRPIQFNDTADRVVWNFQRGNVNLNDVTELEPKAAQNALRHWETSEPSRSELSEASVGDEMGRLLSEIEFLNKHEGHGANSARSVRYGADVMRLTNLGAPAVPSIIEELDRTDDPRMIATLAFVLRAIGDKRGVPALIRAIPRTHVAIDDCNWIHSPKAIDKELIVFFRQHKFKGQGEKAIGCSNAEIELGMAFSALTGGWETLTRTITYGRGTPIQIHLQKKLLHRDAERLGTWWEQHSSSFVHDDAYLKAGVPEFQLNSPGIVAPNQMLATIAGEIGYYLKSLRSATATNDRYVTAFLDLDTGRISPLPEQWRDKQLSDADIANLLVWAENEGFDLTCDQYKTESGKSHFVLRGIGLKAWQLDEKSRKDDVLCTWGEIAKAGRIVTGDYLVPFDKTEGVLDPAGTAPFLVVTREGSPVLVHVGAEATADSGHGDGSSNSDSPDNPVVLAKGRMLQIQLFEAVPSE